MDKELVRKIYLSNGSYAITGRIFGLSKQRIHQIIKEYSNHGRKGRKNKYKKNLDGKKCEVCLKLPAIILHHKDFNNKNDSLKNLMPVCHKCHNLLHVKYRIENKRYSFNNNFLCEKCKTPITKKNYTNGILCRKCYMKQYNLMKKEKG